VALASYHSSSGERATLIDYGDLATTLAYLEAENARSERMRAVVNATFNGFEAAVIH